MLSNRLRRHRFALAAILLAVFSSASCSEPLAPQDSFEGIYVLQSVNGAPLPAVLADNETLQFKLTSDTLTLSANGTGIWISRFDWKHQDGSGGVIRNAITVTLRNEAGALLLTEHPPCPTGGCEMPDDHLLDLRREELFVDARLGVHRFVRLAPPTVY